MTPFVGLLETKLPGTEYVPSSRRMRQPMWVRLHSYLQIDSPRSHTEGALRDTNVQARTGAGSTRVLTLIFVAVGVLNRTPQSQTAGNSAKAPRSLLRQVKDPLGFGLL